MAGGVVEVVGEPELNPVVIPVMPDPELAMPLKPWL